MSSDRQSRSASPSPTDRGRTTRPADAWRRAAAAVLAVSCLSAAAACAPGSGTGSSSSDETLRVSTWGNESRLKLTQQAVDEFTKSNPGVKVSLENNEWASYWDRLATHPAH